MKIKLQKYLIVTLLVLGVLPFTYAQVGINITDPNGGALLDVSSREKGVLIPRINITDLTTIAPISGLISFAEEMAAESLLVYNINDTTGRGFHYWDGTTWVPLGDKNLGKDDLTQSEEPRTYDMNGEDLNFTNGAFGINTPNPNGAIEATSTENYNAYTFTQDNSLTGEKDVFTIEDQDAGGGAQDHSSVLKVLKSGNINSGDNGFSLIELANTGSDPGANKYWISGRKIDESAVLWGVDITDNDFWSKGGLTLGITENTNGTYSSGTFRVDEDGDTSIGTVGAVASAKLELTAADKGFLTTRVSLVATDDATNPINAPATGLLVYNTATAGTGSTAVAPGFYYWDSSRWVALDGTNGKDWSLLGNIGTNSSVNFLGTIDEVDLSFRTHDVERLIIDSNGHVGINGNPNNNYTTSIYGSGGQRGLYTLVESGIGNLTISRDTGLSNYGIVSITGGTNARIPGDLSSVAIVGNSKNYGAYITVDDAAGASNRIAGVFALDSDTDVMTANDIAFAQLAGTFNNSSLSFGGFFQGNDYGIYASGGTLNSIYADISIGSEIIANGDIEAIDDLILGDDIINNSDTNIDIQIGPNVDYRFSSAAFRPYGNGLRDLGLNTNRWGVVYTDNINFNTATTPSDIRLKENVKQLDYGLEKVKELKTFKYNYKEGDKKIHYGLIAQDLIKILPDLITTNEDDLNSLSVNYIELIPILINAIKEQNVLLQIQDDKINELINSVQDIRELLLKENIIKSSDTKSLDKT